MAGEVESRANGRISEGYSDRIQSNPVGTKLVILEDFIQNPNKPGIINVQTHVKELAGVFIKPQASRHHASSRRCYFPSTYCRNMISIQARDKLYAST